MNERVRSYLIETARQKEKFVYYSDVVRDCALDADITTEYGRNELSGILGEVSAFENSQNPSRPLLSSLVIYKDISKNDHGDGFYRIAEQLGKGSYKKLKDELFGFSEAEQCRKYWQNENNYAAYANVFVSLESDFPVFFTQEDLDFFKHWQHQPYDPINEEHVLAKNTLMDTVWEKSIYLGREVVKRVEGFQLDGKKVWHQRGWRENEIGENTQASIFKHYTWVKIFRNTDLGKDIFFTFGVDASPVTEAFVYKIDCQATRDSTLTPSQIELCKSLIPASAKWNEIAFEDLLFENWGSLISICVEFTNTHLAQYDAIVKAVWGEPIPPGLFKNQLIKRDKPKDGFMSHPESEKTFEGVDVDFEGKAKDYKELGDAGEALVKQHEIEFLKSKNLHEKAALVHIVQDGKGYDVSSFDEKGDERFIEVKTTTGNEYSPFYLSENELAFMRQHQGQYSIYRVFKYDAENNFGEYFELKENVENQLLLKPTMFQVLLKRNEI